MYILKVSKRVTDRVRAKMKAVVLLSVIFLIQAAAVVTSADKEYDDDGEEYTSLEVPQLPESSDFDDFLSYGFYRKSCPGVDGIIHRKLKQWYDKDNTIAASIIRLHFHDCVVRVKIHYQFYNIIK